MMNKSTQTPNNAMETPSLTFSSKGRPECHECLERLDCGFCGGPERCGWKMCPSYFTQCRHCKEFKHVSQCCSFDSRAKGRVNKADRAEWVDRNVTIKDRNNHPTETVTR